jgi:hypothetical protein
MGFLDTIRQRTPESRQQGSQPSIAQSLLRDDAAAVPKPRAPEAIPFTRRDRIVIWSAVLGVIAAVAVAAWLGLRDFVVVVPADGKPAADEPSRVAAPGDKRTPAAPSAVLRSAANTKTAIDAGVRAAHKGAADEASAPVGAARHVASVSETAAPPFEAVSDAVAAGLAAAPPEDDYIYSGEGAGVVAPRLVSLGFVHRLVDGLGTRTSRIELVVSKGGTVEHARIFSTPRNWEDALLISRAKTFQFVPAKRDGLPVRYRYVMEVDASP